MFRVLKHNGLEIAGVKIPPAEFMPSNSQWGRLAFTCVNLARANERMRELEKKQEIPSVTAEEVADMEDGEQPIAQPVKRGRGRPRGSKNKV